VARETSAKQVDVMLLIETNSVIGTIWERRQGLVYLMSFCQRYGITVVIPEVALAEARASLLARIDRQLNSLQQLRQRLNDIARAAEMDKLV
jgi:bifunctional pyridoxal-dependent enzyme with beta-cystathionase and maltose regulon repressor activities